MPAPVDPQRRRVLQVGLGACALPTLSITTSNAFAAPSSPSDIVKINLAGLVLDNRYTGISQLARNLDVPAAVLHQTEGDVTSLWLDTLDTSTRLAPQWLAGITAPSSLDCLAYLTRDRKMQTGLRIQYQKSESGSAEYAIDAPLHVLRQIGTLVLEGGYTPDTLSRSITLAAASQGPIEHLVVRGPKAPQQLAGTDASLTFWLLRPVHSI